jgi:hypothetical protein
MYSILWNSHDVENDLPCHKICENHSLFFLSFRRGYVVSCSIDHPTHQAKTKTIITLAMALLLFYMKQHRCGRAAATIGSRSMIMFTSSSHASSSSSSSSLRRATLRLANNHNHNNVVSLHRRCDFSTSVNWSGRTRYKPLVAPIVELTRRLKQNRQVTANSRVPVLKIYWHERILFQQNGNCWLAACEHVFPTGGKGNHLQRHQDWKTVMKPLALSTTTSSSSILPPAPALQDDDDNAEDDDDDDENEQERVVELLSAEELRLQHQQELFRQRQKEPSTLDLMHIFVNDLAELMETKGVAFFGKHPTSQMARLLSLYYVRHETSKASSSSSPQYAYQSNQYGSAIRLFFVAAARDIPIMIEPIGGGPRCLPEEVMEIVTGLARLQLRDTFRTVINYLQHDPEILRWILTQNNTAPLVWSCAVCQEPAPSLFQIVNARPERAVGSHMQVKTTIVTLRAHLSLQYHHHRRIFDKVYIESHGYYVLRANVKELADLCDILLQVVDTIDGTKFFITMDRQRAVDVAQQGTPAEIATIVMAASIVMGSDDDVKTGDGTEETNATTIAMPRRPLLPALTAAIDEKAAHLLPQCLQQVPPRLQSMLIVTSPEQEKELAIQIKELERETGVPLIGQPTVLSPSQQAMQDVINSVLASAPLTVKKKEKKNKKGKKSQADLNEAVDGDDDNTKAPETLRQKYPVSTIATIVYALALLRQPSPEWHRLVEEYAEYICAEATEKDMHRIAAAFERYLGHDIPKFRQAMAMKMTMAPPQQQQDGSDQPQHQENTLGVTDTACTTLLPQPQRLPPQEAEELSPPPPDQQTEENKETANDDDDIGRQPTVDDPLLLGDKNDLQQQSLSVV